MSQTPEWVPEDYFNRLNINDFFEKPQPLEVDLGCGEGSFLLAMAAKYPERNFLGVERLLGRVKKVAKKIKKSQLTNVRVLRLDTKYLVEWLIEPKSVSRVHLLCPDPWPKVRHHKNRFFQIKYLEKIHQVLEPDGEFLFRTDHDEYFEWALEELEKPHPFQRLEWNEDSFYYPKTDFQRLWESQGKSLKSIRLKR